LPACGAAIFLTVAVFLKTGNTQAGWKTLLICLVLLGTNSVVTHATARAFRTREFGHWQALPGDPVEFVRDRRDR
jgi:multisubunit Na+/H+ antiporter MnhG subunit